MTLLLAVSSLLSKLLGILRNNRLADVFGAGEMTDAYYAAFQIPDLIYGLIVLGAISAAFLPIFVRLRKRSSDEAWKFANTILNVFFISVLIAGGVVFLFSDYLVSLLYSGFDGETQAVTADLLKVMILSPILFATSSIWGGIQNSFRTFWGYALAPIVYNLAIIYGIVYLSEPYGIMGVAYGVVIGAALHSLVQVAPVVRLGFRWRPVIEWTKECSTLLRLGLPRILALGTYQVNLLIEGVIAAGLAAGGLTIYRYAQDLQYLPLGIVGISVAISSFSVLSEMAADGDTGKLSDYLRGKIDHILILVIPSAVGLFVLREQIVHLILRSGEFGVESAVLTTEAVAVLCFGLVAGSLIPLLSRVYYSLQNTWIPFVMSVATVVLNAILAYWLSRTMGVVGLAIASAVTMTGNLILLMVMLKKRYLNLHRMWHYEKAVVFLVAALVMGMVVTYGRDWFSWSTEWIPYFVQAMGLVVFGAVVYGVFLTIILKKSWMELVRMARD